MVQGVRFKSPRQREGVILVKRVIAAILATFMLALAIAALPIVSADDPEEVTGVILGRITMSYNPPEWSYWLGTMSGPIKGTVSFVELPFTIDGDFEYFHESFLIETSKGTLSGEDWGVYNLLTGDFWAHGTVMEATDRWAGLVGYTMFEWGVTTEPFVIPMIATNIPVVFVPPEPTPAHAHDVVVTYNDMEFSPSWGYWRGDVSGDMTGAGAIYLDAFHVLEGKEYFFESSGIQTSQGAIQGVDRGVFDLTTGDFWGVGQITDASGRWNFMEGYAYVTFGNVPNVGGDPMTAHAPFVFLDI